MIAVILNGISKAFKYYRKKVFQKQNDRLLWIIVQIKNNQGYIAFKS